MVPEQSGDWINRRPDELVSLLNLSTKKLAPNVGLQSNQSKFNIIEFNQIKFLNIFPGFSVGDELGFRQSLSNLEGNKRRSAGDPGRSTPLQSITAGREVCKNTFTTSSRYNKSKCGACTLGSARAAGMSE